MSQNVSASPGVGYQISTLTKYRPDIADALKAADNPVPSRPGILDQAEYDSLSPQSKQAVQEAVTARENHVKANERTKLKVFGATLSTTALGMGAAMATTNPAIMVAGMTLMVVGYFATLAHENIAAKITKI